MGLDIVFKESVMRMSATSKRTFISMIAIFIVFACVSMTFNVIAMVNNDWDLFLISAACSIVWWCIYFITSVSLVVKFCNDMMSMAEYMSLKDTSNYEENGFNLNDAQRNIIKLSAKY